MAFDKENFNNVSSGGAGTLKLWAYKTSVDALATIMAADYFLPMRFALNTNDLIFVVGTDGAEQLLVSSAINATSVTTVTFDSVPAGTITNADVSATAAIAFSKLAALTSGNVLVGSAGTVPTSVAMSGDVAIIASGATTIQALAVTPGKLAITIPRTISVAVTAAEVNGAYAAPKLILAAASAGTYHVVHGVQYEFDFGAAQFANGGVLGLQYAATVNGAGLLTHLGILAAVVQGVAADFIIGATGWEIAGLVGGAAASVVAQGLYLSNKTAAFDTGDSDLMVHVTYSTVTTSL